MRVTVMAANERSSLRPFDAATKHGPSEPRRQKQGCGRAHPKLLICRLALMYLYSIACFDKVRRCSIVGFLWRPRAIG